MFETILNLILLALVLFSGASIVIYTLINGISPMPTTKNIRRKLLSLFDQLKIHGNILELGSGWGTLAFALAKKYPHSKLLAYENSTIPYMYSRFLNLFFKYNNLRIYNKNFYDIEFKNADVIVCYLYPGAMTRLKKKFESELKEKTLIITHTFAVPNWKPIKQIEANDLYRSKIYVYMQAEIN